MQRREKFLFAGLATTLLIALVMAIEPKLTEPLDQRAAQLRGINATIRRVETQKLDVLRSRAKLKDWQSRSLPPDPLNAQRLYQEWLTGLALSNGFAKNSLKVTPDRRLARGKVYVAIQVSLEAEATLSQLGKFLFHFYRIDLPHRIASLSIDSQDNQGDPRLKVSLTAEGVSMTTAPKRSRLFPRAALVQAVAASANDLNFTPTKAFPKTGPFRVRIGDEYLTVVAGENGKWTVERGVDATMPAAHAADAVVELAPINPATKDKSFGDYQDFIANSPFAKPRKYSPKLDRVGDKVVVRGTPLTFQVKATGFNPAHGKLVFALDDAAPQGLRIDHVSGEVEWDSESSQASGEYKATVTVTQSGSPPTALSETFRLTLRDPNHAPQLNLAEASTRQVYSGQTMEFAAAATDADEPADKLAFSLGEGSPKDATIDATTGSFRWTVPQNVEPGEFEISIVVTDNGTPPLSDSQKIKVTVSDDIAEFTYLIASIVRDNNREAWLFDRSNNKRYVVTEGAKLSISNIDALVLAIGRNFLLLHAGGRTWRLELGRNLRSLQELPEKGKPEPSRK